jgi:crotonobetainyl-CoA:carnitine CoA-transferase CaiB-like acyl-CoA transferase
MSGPTADKPTDSSGPAAGGALAGLRVVDFSHFIAGPYASMILGDYGADVIKIEPPGRGDDFRATRLVGKDLWGAPFLSVNRNKRSVVLDLTTPDGRRIARELIERADVVLENFTTGVMERHGLDYVTVSATNPRLVYCSVSASGRTGPLADRAGFDPIIQAETGFMHLSGHADGSVVSGGTPIIDFTTAMMACTSILAALSARDRIGRGQRVDVALLDQSLSLLSYHAMTYLMTGTNPRPANVSPRKTPAIGTYVASDGPLLLCCLNNRTWERLVIDVLQRPDLFEPPYDTAAGRVRNNTVLIEQLTGIIGGQTQEFWLAKMRAAGVPAAPQSTLEEALTNEDLLDREIVTTIEHPTFGPIPNIATAPRFSGTPSVPPVAAPELGAHTFEVLREILGYDDDRLRDLADRGIINPET